MRVLILRPEPDGSRLAQRLTGHDCIVSPLLEIVACKTPPPIPHPTTLALTSRQAAAPAFRPDWADTPLYAIGPGTAQAARDAGFTAVVHSGDGHALHLRDQLLEALPERILWPSGARIRYDLAAGLAPLTAARWIVYEARPQTLTATAQAALANGAADWVLLTSPRLGPVRRPNDRVRSVAHAPWLHERGSRAGGAPAGCSRGSRQPVADAGQSLVRLRFAVRE
ncbi:uroporphyrinogen-III synthase [Hankyongella ginsenosidimutans]|uniref:Uroporphyrinogen-III synthase n=1 Tax=Hankyongella ginsenosidimutans TaxID=1763828 RepID=A0A4D7C761_9SPHN|nr:uroporphyrinogen-III synthase [Hankyongella ginsenosidimutans]QCI78948.1 uroporphyrinogen-III synthase [Hankyongella ginsenosidimutans]